MCLLVWFCWMSVLNETTTRPSHRNSVTLNLLRSALGKQCSWNAMPCNAWGARWAQEQHMNNWWSWWLFWMNSELSEVPPFCTFFDSDAVPRWLTLVSLCGHLEVVDTYHTGCPLGPWHRNSHWIWHDVRHAYHCHHKTNILNAQSACGWFRQPRKLPRPQHVSGTGWGPTTQASSWRLSARKDGSKWQRMILERSRCGVSCVHSHTSSCSHGATYAHRRSKLLPREAKWSHLWLTHRCWAKRASHKKILVVHKS